MRGLDYKWLEALDAVIRQRSFERAAEHLYISQSAISQRIKQLEKWMSQPVLIREQPPRATLAGQKMLSLYRQVRLLEHEHLPDMMYAESAKLLKVSIATNADSLATWLLPSLAEVMKSHQIELSFTISSEGRTIEKLRSGEVAGAISLESQSIVGCSAQYLGEMEYLCVASPDFYQRYFANGVDAHTLLTAPAISYDQYDELHKQFLFEYFQQEQYCVINHTVPNSEAFVKLALLGVGYCLLPRIQIEGELQQGALVDIAPGCSLRQHLYWHHWELENQVLQAITGAVVGYAQQSLPQ